MLKENDLINIVPENPITELPLAWKTIFIDTLREWSKITLGYLTRMGPIMIIAGFASGLAIQWLSPAIVNTYLGNNLLGLSIAATFGILINVPLLFEIPLVALLLLLGMGTAPAATLLFTAAAAGPVTFWGLSGILPKKSIAAFVSKILKISFMTLAAIFLIGWFSTIIISRFVSASEQARLNPAGPAPIITISFFIIFISLFKIFYCANKV